MVFEHLVAVVLGCRESVRELTLSAWMPLSLGAKYIQKIGTAHQPYYIQSFLLKCEKCNNTVSEIIGRNVDLSKAFLTQTNEKMDT